jgi:hypothetical protein
MWQWLIPVILAIWEAEIIRRILVPGQPRQIVVRPHLQNNQSMKERVSNGER